MSKSIAYDELCKKALSNVDVLAVILKSVVEEVQSYSLEEIKTMIRNINVGNTDVVHNSFIQLQNSEDIEDVNTIRFDIRFNIQLPEPMDMTIYINIEAQNNPNPGYALLSRGIYYVARMISKQYNVEFDSRNYDKMKKAISIWIMPLSSNERDGIINKYTIDEHHLVGNYEEKKEYYDKMSIIMIHIGSNHNADGNIEYYEKYDELLTPLSVLLTDNIKSVKEKKEILKKYHIEDVEEVDTMCNLSEGIYRRGEEFGRVDGDTKRALKSIKSIIKKGYTILQAFDLLDLTDEERTMYQKLLVEQSSK